MSGEIPPIAYREEGWSDGPDGHFILEIRIYQPRPLNENDKKALYRAARELKAALHVESVRLDPDSIRWKEEWLLDAQRMFKEAGMGPIYMEEIPNEYCGPMCCPHRVWLNVTTPLGIIKIGWRKRVVVLDWKKTNVVAAAETLFPNEDTTKDGKLIHAWSYEKVVEYLKVLARQPAPTLETASTLE